MTKLENKAEVIIKDLKNTKYNNYDLIVEGINTNNDLLDQHDIDIYDVEEDGVNLILDRDTVHDMLAESLKADLDQPCVVQDYDRVLHSDDDYYFINGYARVQFVTGDDVLGELDDILNYLDDND